MVVTTNDDPSPHSPFLHLGLPGPQPSRRHHAHSLLGSSFHDPRTHHVLESHPEQAALLSRRNNERRHTFGSHSARALRLYLAACKPFSSCRFWTLDHLCVNLSQSFKFCWITKNPIFEPVCLFTFSSYAFAFLIETHFNFKCLFAIWSLSPQRSHYYFYRSIGSRQNQKNWSIVIPVMCLLCVTLLVCSSYASFAPSSNFFSSWWQKILRYLHIHLFSNVLYRRHRVSPIWPMHLLIIGSHYCAMRFTYALHMHRQNLVLFPCLYIEPLELVIKIIFHYCTTPPCHKINLFKHPSWLWGSRFGCLDDAFVLLVSLIFLYL